MMHDEFTPKAQDGITESSNQKSLSPDDIVSILNGPIDQLLEYLGVDDCDDLDQADSKTPDRPYIENEDGFSTLEAMDRFLQTTKSIPDDLWRAFDEAIGYDSATPVSWAVGRLKILYLRTERGETISVPAANAELSKDTFEQVITEYFSSFIYKCILKPY